MKRYIFITGEGVTVAPNRDVDIKNMQVIGIVENVENEDSALIKLLKENSWIIDAEFNVSEFIVFEIL